MKKIICIIFILFAIKSSNSYTNDTLFSINHNNTISNTEVKCLDISTNGIIDNREELIEAMIWVESNGIDSSYNESERAIGCLQIRPIMIREINRLCKKHEYSERWVHADAWDREKSISMFKIWSKLTNVDSIYEKSARNWNGGPKGYKKSSTAKYWIKCKKYAMKNL